MLVIILVMLVMLKTIIDAMLLSEQINLIESIDKDSIKIMECEL